MLCQITSVLDYPVQNNTSDVQTCFLITATPIVAENENVDIDTLFAEGGDISDLANKSNISPFRTILFPISTKVENAFMRLIEDNEKRVANKEKPKYPTINLNRFEVATPEPYFRRLTKDSDNGKEGEYILASDGDEVFENDPKGRKVFRTLWVTSICKTEKGEDIPTENITRKALRAWQSGIEVVAGSGYMLEPCKETIEKENKRAQRQTLHDSGDDLLVEQVTRQTRVQQRANR